MSSRVFDILLTEGVSESDAEGLSDSDSEEDSDGDSVPLDVFVGVEESEKVIDDVLDASNRDMEFEAEGLLVHDTNDLDASRDSESERVDDRSSVASRVEDPAEQLLDTSLDNDTVEVGLWEVVSVRFGPR